jgi:hypothetical protein
MSNDTLRFEPNTPQKCCFIGCNYYGVPDEGFDFFMCAECGDRLEQLLWLEHAKAEARKAVN